MAELPDTNSTFLFTDIEGSTKLWERSASVMQIALIRHDKILRNAMDTHGGHVFKTVGDAICAVFDDVSAALGAAFVAQQDLVTEP